jgi:hypothetical protein
VGLEADMAEDFDPSVLEESPEVVEDLLRDAVEMAAAEGDLGLGDVDVPPGEVVAVVSGVEIRHLTDEGDHVLPVEDENGELIGNDTFPEVPDLPLNGRDG